MSSLPGQAEEDSRRWGTLLNRVDLLFCAAPLIHYAFTLLFYACASISLGEWADTTGAHDPKAFLGGIPAFLSIILLLLSFAVAPLVGFLGYRKRRMALYMLLYGIALALDVALFRVVTPWLGAWIGD